MFKTSILSTAKKMIDFGYLTLFFITPLLVLPYSHELFEFPKMMFVYFLTGLILISYGVYSAGGPASPTSLGGGLVSKFHIKSLIPFGLFLSVNLISSVNSINKYTSFFGYYTRFDDGLVSLICFAVLFYVFVKTQFEKSKGGRSPACMYRYIDTLIISGVFVSIYAIAQHFGIDKDYWVQNSAARAFSTLGQPNWLAAFLAAIIPISIAQMINQKEKGRKIAFLVTPIVTFAGFWFTYSLSGILGLAGGLLVLGIFALKSEEIKNTMSLNKYPLVILVVSYILIIIIFPGMFLTRLKDTGKGIKEKLSYVAYAAEENLEAGPGNTANIRLTLWKSTLSLIKSKPLFGSGPENFAYAFLPNRTKELNQTTEWSFLYNKAHNEYLNLAACTGIVGVLTYLYLLFWLGKIQVEKLLNEKDNRLKIIRAGIFSGWLTILITNFFGFSVVNTNLLLFLLPAIAFSYGKENEQKQEKANFIPLIVLNLLGAFLIALPLAETTTDIIFAEGEREEGMGSYEKANDYFKKAVKINPFEPAYSRELAFSLAKEGNFEEADFYAQRAFALNPYNSLSLKSLTRTYFVMAESENDYYKKAETVAKYTANYIPTDPQASYNLAVIYFSEGKLKEAREEIKRTLELKPDYLEARKVSESL